MKLKFLLWAGLCASSAYPILFQEDNVAVSFYQLNDLDVNDTVALLHVVNNSDHDVVVSDLSIACANHKADKLEVDFYQKRAAIIYDMFPLGPILFTSIMYHYISKFIDGTIIEFPVTAVLVIQFGALIAYKFKYFQWMIRQYNVSAILEGTQKVLPHSSNKFLVAIDDKADIESSVIEILMSEDKKVKYLMIK